MRNGLPPAGVDEGSRGDDSMIVMLFPPVRLRCSRDSKGVPAEQEPFVPRREVPQKPGVRRRSSARVLSVATTWRAMARPARFAPIVDAVGP
ncbi:hypothetical protein GCM10011600_24370 [Pseudolysinimonas yzui]|uniref:Uncharacterized protein n=1 Tax=Pseudolysinimonas yzui TaxID=2708254 RepID=A0A8J3GS95_9MICO|nr:hypothetical protein GCM10011600_24370 [Pseudolysinimonas yzui]